MSDNIIRIGSIRIRRQGKLCSFTIYKFYEYFYMIMLYFKYIAKLCLRFTKAEIMYKHYTILNNI